VQGLLEDALKELDGGEVAVAGAGRTDAGVHALGQVASFSLRGGHGPDVVVRALNARLPPTIRVHAAEEVPPEFHARFAARSKTYRYRIWNGPVASPFERRHVWHIIETLDVPAMNAAAQMLVGRHDFAAFQATGSDAASTEREVLSSVVRGPHAAIGNQSAFRLPPSALLEYEISGTGFLRHMVRVIVGTLVEIGRGRKSAEWMQEVLASRDRSAAGRTAPPDGLFLDRVDY
jgi:tRNA pseudouridine38-40 synthase